MVSHCEHTTFNISHTLALCQTRRNPEVHNVSQRYKRRTEPHSQRQHAPTIWWSLDRTSESSNGLWSVEIQNCGLFNHMQLFPRLLLCTCNTTTSPTACSNSVITAIYTAIIQVWQLYRNIDWELCFKHTLELNRFTLSDCSVVKLAFHDADTDTDFLARILADTSDTRDWSYSCDKLNDTPTSSRQSSRECRRVV